jgi:23S rRNA (cytosine1962-C5)-methyltransferase
VYDNEVECVLDGKGGAAAELAPGECADVESSRKQYLGRAIVNPNSKIIARIYSPSKEGLDKGFFKRRIREALRRREAFRDISRESARIVFAEADFLPGLIIDRFVGWPPADIDGLRHTVDTAAANGRPLGFDLVHAALGPPRSWLVIQFLAWGMDCRRDMIIEALEEALGAERQPAGIIEKSAARARELEGLLPGLPACAEPLRGTFPAGGVVIFENDYPFAVNLPEGQKTGHFLDQRDNRLLAGKYAALLRREVEPAADSGAADDDNGGKPRPLRILDACSYTGGFGIHALRAAEQATLIAVDVSAAALEALQTNAALNNAAGRIAVVEADVFDYLKNAGRRTERFDMIILDPPAFAKSRSALPDALRGYKEINLRAIHLLRPGGILITCSCSQALDEARFKRMIADAAADAGRRLVQLDFRGQPPDHPVLVGYDESVYLKCGFYRAL